MYWNEIRRTEHFEKYHKVTLAWSDVVRLIYVIKNKRKKGNKIEIEDNKFSDKIEEGKQLFEEKKY